MSRLTALLALLLLAGCAAPPMPREVAAQGRVYLPAVPVAGYQWPVRGFGHPPEAWAVSHAALIGERPAWYYDWWWDCSRWAGDQGVYIPSVMRAWHPEVMACNDGRPLLVLNEPEERGQAELTPEQAAAVLHQAAVSGWTGPVYCCGTQAAHLPYMQRLVTAYRMAYGAWPADGLHVHVYHGVAELDAFVQWASGEGILGQGVVVSEFGLLTEEPISVDQMGALTTAIEARPVVLTSAWFSVNYAPWRSSDLVDSDGTLTALGEEWTGWTDVDAAARGRVIRGD